MRAVTLFCIRILPGIVVRIFAIPVGFFFWLISGSERKAIAGYLKRVRPDRKPYTLPLFLAFSITIIEKVESWAGKIKLGKIHFQQDDITEICKITGGCPGRRAVSRYNHNLEGAGVRERGFPYLLSSWEYGDAQGHS